MDFSETKNLHYREHTGEMGSLIRDFPIFDIMCRLTHAIPRISAWIVIAHTGACGPRDERPRPHPCFVVAMNTPSQLAGGGAAA
jgi:hypothetical protein